jgi:DHA2 family lincomycin resistance protein-like MFS transporter
MAIHPPIVSPWIPLLLGAAVIAIFIVRQLFLQTENRALLDMRTLTYSGFTIAMTMMAILMMSMFGAFILLPIYLQNVLGLTTLQTGLLLLPGGLIMGLCAPTVGRLFDKHGPVPLVIPGAILLSVALWGLTFIQQDTPFWLLLVAHLTLSVGLAMMFTPLFTVSLGALPPNLYSHGSAMLGATQQVAGAAGVALFVAIMTLRSAALAAGGADLYAVTTGGIKAAFLYGAFISLAAVVAAFFIKKPETPASGGTTGH